LASVGVPNILETLGTPLKNIGVFDTLETLVQVLPPQIWSFWIITEKFDPMHPVFQVSRLFALTRIDGLPTCM